MTWILTRLNALWLLLVIAAALPTFNQGDPDDMLDSLSLLENPSLGSKAASVTFSNSTLQYRRTVRCVYTAISCISLMLQCGMIGSRMRNFRLVRRSFLRILVAALYTLPVLFVFSAAILESGLGLYTLSMCKGVIYVTVLCYFASKVVIYLFLIERVHAIRAPNHKRLRDWIWLTMIAAVLVGFGAIAVIAFIWPIANAAPPDVNCRIGFPLKVTIPLLVYDIVINIALTGVFIRLLLPLMRFQLRSSSNSVSRQSRQSPDLPLAQSSDPLSSKPSGSGAAVSPFHNKEQLRQLKRPKCHWHTRLASLLATAFTKEEIPPQVVTIPTAVLNKQRPELPRMGSSTVVLLQAPPPTSLERLVAKSFVANLLVMAPTIANLVVMLAFRGNELGWLCLTLSTIDVTWAVCVVHWLTSDPAESERRRASIAAAKDRATASTPKPIVAKEEDV